MCTSTHTFSCLYSKVNYLVFHFNRATLLEQGSSLLISLQRSAARWSLLGNDFIEPGLQIDLDGVKRPLNMPGNSRLVNEVNEKEDRDPDVGGDEGRCVPVSIQKDGKASEEEEDTESKHADISRIRLKTRPVRDVGNILGICSLPEAQVIM
jgi:hypothetical protein